MEKNIHIGKMILQKLESKGYEAYFIGGTSRDMLLNRYVHDIDITTNAKPEEIILALSEYSIKNKDGLFYGTVKYCIEDVDVEITTFRKEGTYVRSRRPMKVEFIDSKEEDSLRRDFTINAIYMDLRGNTYDFHNGIKDLKNRVITTIGDPRARFREDALRILRAIRFSIALDMSLSDEVISAIKENSYLINDLKENVINKELAKIKKLKCAKELDKIFFALKIDLEG